MRWKAGLTGPLLVWKWRGNPGACIRRRDFGAENVCVCVCAYVRVRSFSFVNGTVSP